MRLVTYRSQRGDRAGVIDGDEVVDAWDALGRADLSSLRELISEGLLGELSEAATGADQRVPLAGAELLTPIPDPEKIICIGLNYGSHAEETGRDAPDAPTIFGKFRNALAASGDVVTLPAASRKVDYEAEIAFVVGRSAREVQTDQALDHIAGVMLFNDLSARDLQFQTPQWMAGKVFDGSAPCGPALVTLDETGPLDGVEFSLQLNGETMQSASTADLIFSIPALLAHLSNLMTLRPGDSSRAERQPASAAFASRASGWETATRS